MIDVGIVGVGPLWDEQYRPAVRRLGRPISVRAVFDPVFSRAQQAAAEFSAVPTEGLVALAERRDLRAVLLLDPGWYGWESLRILCSYRKPVYVASYLRPEVEPLQELNLLADSQGLTVMPGLARRFAPATVRLRELMATCLGAPRRIVIEAATRFAPKSASRMRKLSGPHAQGDTGDSPGASLRHVALLPELLDWCRYVLGSRPTRVAAKYADPRGSGAAAGGQITVFYRQPKGVDAEPTAELSLSGAALQGAGSRDAAGMRVDVVCASGTATISSPREIAWRLDDGDSRSESLMAERSEVEVMLDHFCRRVVGGLIPVAGISDVLQTALLLEAADESLKTGSPVEFNGRM